MSQYFFEKGTKYRKNLSLEYVHTDLYNYVKYIKGMLYIIQSPSMYVRDRYIRTNDDRIIMQVYFDRQFSLANSCIFVYIYLCMLIRNNLCTYVGFMHEFGD